VEVEEEEEETASVFVAFKVDVVEKILVVKHPLLK